MDLKLFFLLFSVKTIVTQIPPLYLLLGGDAYNRALSKLNTLHNEIREWQDVTCSTDFEYDTQHN